MKPQQNLENANNDIRNRTTTLQQYDLSNDDYLLMTAHWLKNEFEDSPKKTQLINQITIEYTSRLEEVGKADDDAASAASVPDDSDGANEGGDEVTRPWKYRGGILNPINWLWG